MMKKMIVIMMTKTTMHHLEVGFDSGKMTGVSVPSPMAVSTGSVKRPPTPDRPADCAEWGGGLIFCRKMTITCGLHLTNKNGGLDILDSVQEGLALEAWAGGELAGGRSRGPRGARGARA